MLPVSVQRGKKQPTTEHTWRRELSGSCACSTSKNALRSGATSGSFKKKDANCKGVKGGSKRGWTRRFEMESHVWGAVKAGEGADFGPVLLGHVRLHDRNGLVLHCVNHVTHICAVNVASRPRQVLHERLCQRSDAVSGWFSVLQEGL